MAKATKLPPSIRVGYRDFKLEHWPVNEARADQSYGQCDKGNAIIRIDASISASVTANTVLHELLHACWTHIPEEHEELTVSVLADHLTQVWRDNPELVKWLTKNIGA